MTNYDQMKKLLKEFADKYVQKIPIESMLSEVSEDKARTNESGNRKLVYEKGRKDMQVIDMDEVAHHIYRIARFPESKKESESPASADAFVISADNMYSLLSVSVQKKILR